MKLQTLFESTTKSIILNETIDFNFNDIFIGQKFIYKGKDYFYLNRFGYEFGAEHYLVCELKYREVPGLHDPRTRNCDIILYTLRDFGKEGFDITPLKI